LTSPPELTNIESRRCRRQLFYQLPDTTPGCFVKAGVYKGGSASLLRSILDSDASRTLHLFDTFEGMTEADHRKDMHRAGDFSDTSLEQVRKTVGEDRVVYHPGLLPGTFSAIEGERIAFAHVDVDLFSSVTACCEFMYPRMSAGGCIVFDDYTYPTCPGAGEAVDRFFRDKPEVPHAYQGGGPALVIKLPAHGGYLPPLADTR
jgi:O-methyltransferase